jgi:hypothetical protein
MLYEAKKNSYNFNDDTFGVNNLKFKIKETMTCPIRVYGTETKLNDEYNSFPTN